MCFRESCQAFGVVRGFEVGNRPVGRGIWVKEVHQLALPTTRDHFLNGGCHRNDAASTGHGFIGSNSR